MTLVKTRGIKYFNVETWTLFAPLLKFLATPLLSVMTIYQLTPTLVMCYEQPFLCSCVIRLSL